MNYGMFSPKGELAVSGIVAYHKSVKSPWSLVEQNLIDLAKYDPDYAEATDTVVRENVYVALYGDA
jgi:hypothetical protein